MQSAVKHCCSLQTDHCIISTVKNLELQDLEEYLVLNNPLIYFQITETKMSSTVPGLEGNLSNVYIKKIEFKCIFGIVSLYEVLSNLCELWQQTSVIKLVFYHTQGSNWTYWYTFFKWLWSGHDKKLNLWNNALFAFSSAALTWPSNEHYCKLLPINATSVFYAHMQWLSERLVNTGKVILQKTCHLTVLIFVINLKRVIL